VLPLSVAVRVVMVEVPLIFRVALAACVSPPVPMSAVDTVRELLLVRMIPRPVTVTLGMENVPVRACEFVSKVCIPLPAVKAGLLVIPPRKVIAELPELFQVPPVLTVTNPVKILVPVEEDTVRLPLVPAPMVVVPVTVKAKPAAVKVVPSPMLRLPVIARPTTMVAFAVPLRVRLPPIVVVPVCNVLAPPPDNVRLL